MASALPDGKLDIHRANQRYEQALSRLESDTYICSENRQLILDFLNACQLGKTVFGREKKRINEKRLLKYLYTLRRINHWLGNTDLRTTSQEEMERFVGKVDRNALTVPSDTGEVPASYTAWTRRDIKVCLKKFYKWLLGDGRQYPEIVAWVDTHIQDEAPPCLTIEEVRRCVSYATTIKGKAIIWCLFETGARAEELLNIRLGHVEDRKTHFILRIEHSKTYRRSIPVYESAAFLRTWLAEHPYRGNEKAQLFPVGYQALRKFTQRVGQRALNKKVHPHLLRHSFATWLASKKVGRYQMCKLMGWAMSSDMPDRYIDRVGVVEEEAIQSIRSDELSKVERENVELKGALERLEAQYQQVQERLQKQDRIDAFLEALLKDKDTAQVFARKVQKLGLGEKLTTL